MRNIYLTIGFVTCFLLSADAQPLSWIWSKSFGGVQSSDSRMDIIKDDLGNMYVTGDFTGNKMFGSVSLNATGFNEIFVLKFNANGTFAWAIKGGANFSVANTSGLLYINGGLYVAGSFNNVLTCGSISVNSAGQGDIFLMKLDPANGNCLWIQTAGGPNDDKCFDLDGNAAGGIALTGTYTTTANFGSETLNNGMVGNIDCYLANYDLSGNCNWVVSAGGNSTDESYAVKMNSIGVTYITGYYQDSIYFDASNIFAGIGSYDFFLAKYHPSGSVVWARNGGGLGTDFGSSIGFDYLGDVYILGYVSDTAYYGSNVIYDNSAGNYMLLKYNSSGNALWAIDEGGPFFDQGVAMSTDPLGGSYVTGFIANTTDLSGVVLNGTNDPFIAKYDYQSNLRWATMLPSTSYATGKSILYDDNGFCFIGGYYFGTISIGTQSWTAPANEFACYFARLSGGTVGIEENDYPTFSVYPNPATDKIFVNLSDVTDAAFTVEVISLTGQVVYSERLSYGIMRTGHTIDVSRLASGTYSLLVSSSKGDVTRKFIKR